MNSVEGKGSSLAGAASRGAALSIVGQFLRLVVQISCLIWLARLLSAESYGIMAMVTAVAGIASVLADFGLSLAGLQAKELTANQRSNLFWANLVVGAIASGCVFAAAPMIAAFYHKPEVLLISMAISPLFLLNAAGVQFRVELNRALRYRGLITVESLAAVVSGALAIVCAYRGLEYWSLLVQQLSQALIVLVGLVIVCPWRPSLPRRHAGMRGLYSFGSSAMGIQVINYVSSNADSLSIGRFLGAEQLGVYSRMFQIFALPLQQIAGPLTRVALPVLQAAGDRQRSVAYLFRAQFLLNYVLLACLSLLASGGGPLIELLLGAQWVDGAKVLQLLALGGVFQTIGYSYFWAYLAFEGVRKFLVLEGLGRLLMTVAVVWGARTSIEGAAWGYCFGLAATYAICSLGLRRINLRFGDFFRVAVRPVAVFGACYSACLSLRLSDLLPSSQLPATLLIMTLWLGVAGVCLLVSPSFRRDLRVLATTARMTRGK